MLQLVFARCPSMTIEGVTEQAFGLNDGLPWGHISQDMKNFSARTKNTVLVMGAKTFETFYKPLKDRDHVVVCDPERSLPTTGDGSNANAYITMDEFKSLLNGADVRIQWATNDGSDGGFAVYNRNREPFSIIGGKSLLEIALPHVDKVVETKIIKRHRVNSDVQLSDSFVHKVLTFGTMVETHWWKIDELTDIIETVYEAKNV